MEDQVFAGDIRLRQLDLRAPGAPDEVIPILQRDDQFAGKPGMGDVKLKSHGSGPLFRTFVKNPNL